MQSALSLSELARQADIPRSTVYWYIQEHRSFFPSNQGYNSNTVGLIKHIRKMYQAKYSRQAVEQELSRLVEKEISPTQTRIPNTIQILHDRIDALETTVKRVESSLLTKRQDRWAFWK